MNNQYVIYEDSKWKHFGTPVFTRPVFHLRYGTMNCLQRLESLSINCKYLIRNYLEGLYDKELIYNTETASSERIFLNGRVAWRSEDVDLIMNHHPNTFFTYNSEVIAFKIDGKTKDPIRLSADGTIENVDTSSGNIVDITVVIYDYIWEFIEKLSDNLIDDISNPTLISKYSKLVNTHQIQTNAINNVYYKGSMIVSPGVVIDSKNHPVLLEENVNLGAGCILSSVEGPILIDEGASLEAGCIINGPAYIGKHSIVRSAARLTNVALGDHCRVGGEINTVIIQGYSNKQHSGYLGSSFLGEWVNLGAATDNSDLKNNYQPVDVIINGKKYSSNNLHIGVFLGDFCRTAIHTRLNSGTMVGACCNLFGIDFPPKEIPSFSWVTSDDIVLYKYEKAIETIDTIMKRRKISLTSELEAVLKHLFNER